MRFLYLFLILLIGCGDYSTTPHSLRYYSSQPEIKFDDTLYNYYQDFINDLIAYGVPIQYRNVRVMSFDALDKPEVLGYCMTYSETFEVQEGYTRFVEWKTILISERLADNIIDLRVVMYHECGHCFLNAEHVDDEYDLMYPYITDKNDGDTEEEWSEIKHKFFERMSREIP